jgi:hypothetical protein
MIPQRRHFEMIWLKFTFKLINQDLSQIQQRHTFGFQIQQSLRPVLEHIEVHFADFESLTDFINQTLFFDLEGTVRVTQFAQIN